MVSGAGGKSVFDCAEQVLLTLHTVLQRIGSDVGVLQAVGFREIQTRCNIIEHLWDDKEKQIYGSTPMFEIAARK